VYVFFFPPFLPHGRPISSSFINQTKHIRLAVPIMKLLITQFSSASCHFLPFRSQYLRRPIPHQ
jgi:putative component of membrane protein insertase Oxa1/YidC/SpoIIIJ protein YidD